MNFKFWKKRDPYRLTEDQMTPEEYDMVFPPDDGIDFQWGPSYIKHREVIKGVGGKYWKWNPDGTITEFEPEELRVETGIMCLETRRVRDFKILEKSKIVKLEFDSEARALIAENTLAHDLFFTTRGCSAIASGKILTIECIIKGTHQGTYFPAKSDYSKEDVEEI